MPYGQQSQLSMKPLSAKELEYIVDSISNEDLLIKQCAATAASTNHPAIQQTLSQMASAHQQHLNVLVQSLQQHAQIAPTHAQQQNQSQ
ncbi:hypothetical protein WJ0W_003388 [Paenibacillus melissococcoides]|uniref:Spore coat protein n=1 Tax=Paenibacillus melissococcoides TaxID=2912268 RepID=A0ABM9G3B5_9BACL|nr:MULTISPECIES: hypothetical protein [Paenibacillus]MEB9895063.1 hypothetical protein [Bacillus cereus]CAH8246152.1 hypothetical protein WJ0W_003388 [Paenibacillus melissococcoides]CAH8713120.1 hypothetical protein WDD9_003464 [Paenibacillus melissococcoides]CAH8713855.1 hypothetical protein HTL2_003767 [Paenibacillus melissococcoides]GIO80294.1 hypothetical protein J6TS7_39040 [Paenibacillus dendritiformis]